MNSPAQPNFFKFQTSSYAPTVRVTLATLGLLALPTLTWGNGEFAHSTLLGPNIAQAQQKGRVARRAAQEVYVNMGDEPPSMDPTKQVDAISGFWLGHLYEGLMTTDKNGKIIAGSAEKVDVSADGKTYTFTLRKNAKWHDGKPVTAADFEFAFKRLVDPTYASEYAFIAETAQILNATEVINKKSPLDSLGVKAESERVLKITLKNPVAFLPSLMMFQSFYPVRKDLVEKYRDQFSVTPESIVGNGPFKLVRWKKENGMRLEKAETYWNAAEISIAAIESPVMLKDFGATYNLYMTGGVDMVNLDTERLKLANAARLPVKSFQNGFVTYLRPNPRPNRIFKSEKLRQAIKFGINRSEFVNKITGIPGDKGAFGFVPDYMPGSTPGSTYRKEAPLSWKDGDLAKARALVKEYLAESGQTKVPAFTLLAADSSTAKRDSEYFQAQLRKIFETEVNVDSVPFKTRLQKQRDADYDIVFGSWGPDYLDPSTFLELFLPVPTDVPGGFNDATFNGFIEKARQSTDLKARVGFFHEAEKILVNGGWTIPVQQVGRAFTVADGLQGVKRVQIGQDPDFRFAKWAAAK